MAGLGSEQEKRPQLSHPWGGGLGSGSHEDIIIFSHYSNLLFLWLHLLAAAAGMRGTCILGHLHTWASWAGSRDPHGPGRPMLLPRFLQGPGEATRAPSRSFPGSAPSPPPTHCCLLTQGPQCSGRADDDVELGRDVISGWRQPLARLHP